jgi:predicted dehydrogenase
LVNQAPHLLDLFLWYMGEIAEIFGCWSNLNHPYIEVEDTALAIIRFKSGALGNIVLSNSQNPGLYGNVHIFGEYGTAIGVQPEGGSMFIAGMTTVQEPPINDLWTVAGEADLLSQWQEEDRRFFTTIDPIKHYFTLQLEDFLTAIRLDRTPSVTGFNGRRVVELFNAIYRSQQSKQPVQFPLT